MSNDSLPDDATIAQRPRLVRRLRLVPLGVLCLLMTTAAVVGAVHGGKVTAGAPASALPPDPAVKAAEKAQRVAERTADRAGKAKKTCMPKFDTGIRSEPWEGKRKQQSEKAFKKQIKKDNPNYVSGKGGWKFFTDPQVDNFSQALGRVTQTAKQEKQWAKWIAKQARIAKQYGATYHVVISPANWDIYPKKLPAWAQKLRGSTSLQHLMADHPELPWIDTRAALTKAARAHDTYSPLDSHWSPYGGYVAWQAITKCLRSESAAYKPLTVPPITGVGIRANTNEFAAYGVPDGTPATTYPIYAAAHPAVTATHLPDGAPIANSPDFETDTLQAPMKTVTPAAQAPGLSVLTLRDSTGNALSPLWSSSFGTTIQYGHGIGQPQGVPDLGALMATHHPQVVLFVITERFLTLPAPK